MCLTMWFNLGLGNYGHHKYSSDSRVETPLQEQREAPAGASLLSRPALPQLPRLPNLHHGLFGRVTRMPYVLGRRKLPALRRSQLNQLHEHVRHERDNHPHQGSWLARGSPTRRCGRERAAAYSALSLPKAFLRLTRWACAGSWASLGKS